MLISYETCSFRQNWIQMKKRRIGNSGPEVSEIGFGAWAIGGSWGAQSEKDSHLGLESALDRGVNFIDTAAGIMNTAVSSLPELSDDILEGLREHSWNRGFWYGGK